MQSVKRLVQIHQDVKENNATLSSGTFSFGSPPKTGASEEITYPYTGLWLNNSQLNGNMLSVSFTLYFADRVNPELNNELEALSALHISAVQFLAQLDYTLKYSYNARLTQNTPLDDFEGKWNDYVTGWQCELTIDQYYNKSTCDIPSSGNNSGKVLILDQDGNTISTLNPDSTYTVTQLTTLLQDLSNTPPTTIIQDLT